LKIALYEMTVTLSYGGIQKLRRVVAEEFVTDMHTIPPYQGKVRWG